jgi:hypothetical protein
MLSRNVGKEPPLKLRDTPEELRSQIYRGGSLKSRIFPCRLPNYTESDPKLLSSGCRHRTSNVPEDRLIQSAGKSCGNLPLGLRQTPASDVEESGQPTHPKLQWYKEQVRRDGDKSVSDRCRWPVPSSHPTPSQPTVLYWQVSKSWLVISWRLILEWTLNVDKVCSNKHICII